MILLPTLLLFSLTGPTCVLTHVLRIPARKSWRGCGQHIAQALDGVPQSQWCTCEQGRVSINGISYPAAAGLSIPGLSWLSGLFGGRAGGQGGGDGNGGRKDDL